MIQRLICIIILFSCHSNDALAKGYWLGLGTLVFKESSQLVQSSVSAPFTLLAGYNENQWGYFLDFRSQNLKSSEGFLEFDTNRIVFDSGFRFYLIQSSSQWSPYVGGFIGVSKIKSTISSLDQITNSVGDWWVRGGPLIGLNLNFLPLHLGTSFKYVFTREISIRSFSEIMFNLGYQF